MCQHCVRLRELYERMGVGKKDANECAHGGASEACFPEWQDPDAEQPPAAA